MSKFLSQKSSGFFDRSDRLNDLLELGDPLARLDSVIDWTCFEPVLARLPVATPKGPGGRPAYAPLFMFKVLVIQSLFNLSDRQIQFQVTDRISFKNFLGMTDADKAPDEKTVWAFRESLKRASIAEELFNAFNELLESKGLFPKKGQIIDATFVEVKRQRNTREENEMIKKGETPAEWDQTPSKARQKDTDARWTRKNDQRFFGYKNHVKVDSDSKLIVQYAVTDAAVHDSQLLERLVRPGDPTTYADSAYSGKPSLEIFSQKGVDFKPMERAWRNRPLKKKQQKANQKKSRTRVRIEHVFGLMTMCMHRSWNRCVGKFRNETAIAMTNLVYNMIRFEQIERLDLKTWKCA
jgi:IS5 family transposase